MKGGSTTIAVDDRPRIPSAVADLTSWTPARRSRVLRRVLVAADFAVLVAVWTAANLLWSRETAGASPAEGLASAALIAGAGVGLIASQQLYLARVATMHMVEQARLLRVSLYLAAVAAMFGWAVPGPVSPVWVGAGGALSLVGLLVSRGSYRAWLGTAREAGRFTRPIAIVGIDDHARDLRQLFREHPELGFTVVAAFGDVRAARDADMEDVRAGDIDQAVPILQAGAVTGAVVSATAIPPTELDQIVRELVDHTRCHVHLSTGVSGIDQRRLRPVHMAYQPLICVEPREWSPAHAAVKRTIDVVLGTVLGLLTLPVLAVSALVIKLADRGPVLFCQTRIGRGGRPFRFCKLRTMTLDAEAKLGELATLNERNGPLFKMARDPRITPVGRVLRELSIDELPQLWNVLKGEMSLVGPRPAMPGEVARFGERLRQRNRVRPGLTGLWQVEARDNPSFHAYERLDLFYVENSSIGLDVVILVATIESQLARVLRRFVTPAQASPATVAPPQVAATRGHNGQDAGTSHDAA